MVFQNPKLNKQLEQAWKEFSRKQRQRRSARKRETKRRNNEKNKK